MNVRQLIIELMDFSLDASVDININSNQEGDYFDFELSGNSSTFNDSVSLEVKLKNHVLVDSRDFEDLEVEIETLRDEVELLQSEMEEL